MAAPGVSVQAKAAPKAELEEFLKDLRRETENLRTF
jgi:hypothetical protein